MEKKLIKAGNCDAIIIDKTMKEISGINSKETVEIKCGKNRITIMKKQEEKPKKQGE